MSTGTKSKKLINESEMTKMFKKTWIIVVVVVLVVAFGATAAFAATEDDEWYRFGKGRRTEEDTFDRGYMAGNMNEDRLSELVEDGLLTQTQADSILAGDADCLDFIDAEDLEGLHPFFNEDGFRGRGNMGSMMNEDMLALLVEDGILTQAQADSILAGDADCLDFVDAEDLDGLHRNIDENQASYGRKAMGRGRNIVQD